MSKDENILTTRDTEKTFYHLPPFNLSPASPYHETQHSDNAANEPKRLGKPESDYLGRFLDWLEDNNSGQKEYIRSVKAVVRDITGLLGRGSCYREDNILYFLAQPNRLHSFKIFWEDDHHRIRVNRGWRVQHYGCVGPYSGGLCFKPGMDQSAIKRIAFEQTFKNGLMGRHIGGSKGGTNFDPRLCSADEILRFSQAFINHLYRQFREERSLPVSDKKIVRQEISWLTDLLLNFTTEAENSVDDHSRQRSRTFLQAKAAGYGLIHIVNEVLCTRGDTITGKRITISGTGLVALHAAKKAISQGAVVQTLSTQHGVLYAQDGITQELPDQLIKTPQNATEVLKSSAVENSWQWHEQQKPWQLACDIALPCACHNEITIEDACALVKNRCAIVAEGAGMSCTKSATEFFEKARILHLPGIAASAGELAIPEIELRQIADNGFFDFDDFEGKLQWLMAKIHRQCLRHSPREGNWSNYRQGANIAAFKSAAEAIYEQGMA